MEYKIRFLFFAIGLSLLLFSCGKLEDTYQDFIALGESTYPGKADSVNVFSGRNRAKISWLVNSDPKIAEYRVFWNQGLDSVVVDDLETYSWGDTISVILDGLEEAAYTFEIYSYDEQGNHSLGVSAIGRSYGESYEGSLLNRGAVFENRFEGNLVIWTPGDTDAGVRLSYQDVDGNWKFIHVAEDESITSLPSWLPGGELVYQTAFVPSGAIDTFYASERRVAFPEEASDTFMLEKRRFKTALLPGDITGANYGGSLEKLWNNVVAPYDDWYHSNWDGEVFPHLFTIDLGVYAPLSGMWIYPSLPERNPTAFELWAIADTTDAVPVLPVTDPGWKQECLDKGWVLLKREIRTDPSESTSTERFWVDIPKNIPVRFLRYRLESTWANNQVSSLSEWEIWSYRGTLLED